MKAEAGFTLMEAMVTSVLSAVLAGAILSIFQMNNAQVKESGSKFLLASYYNALSKDIQRTARRAYMVKVPGDPDLPVTDPFFVQSAGPPHTQTVVFCDVDGDTLGGFRVQSSDGKVRRLSRPGSFWSWEFVVFGGDTVTVSPVTSHFEVYPKRRGFAFQLDMHMRVGGILDSLPPLNETESVICRNGYR